jgi:uncharacterized protein involved in outer membrane biogenesis
LTTETATQPEADETWDKRRSRRRKLAWIAAVFTVLTLLAALAAAIWDWNWLRGPLARTLAARTHRAVTITGDLRVHPWSWRPSASVDGVRIGAPAWAGPGDLANLPRISVQIRLLPLLGGHLDLQLLAFDRPQLTLYRDPNGRASWDFSNGAKPDEPLRMPPIRKFVIDGGHVDYRDDDRKLTFTGTIDARERLGVQDRGFQMDGRGALNAQPFTLQVTGGPLLSIDRAKPYPFDADIRAGQTYVTARGAVPKPFDLAHFYMDATARGPDLADLYGITGVPLPNTPPYQLSGHLSRDLRLWRIDRLGGRVGSSDLEGWLSVQGGGKRPMLKADLRSRRLAFPDLGALFGGAPRIGRVASPIQAAVARKMRVEQRIFPDATLNFDRIRKLDADVSYRATSITQAPVDLTAGSARVRLDAGLLRAEPLTLDLPQGRLSGWIQLNGRGENAVTDLDLRLANARLEHLVPVHFQGGPPFAGPLVGRARLHGVGDSVHDAIGDAYGEVMVVAPGGEIRQSLAELAGVNLIKGLGLLLSHDQHAAPINCAVAHFDVKSGVMNANRLVVDTGPVVISGGGVINLDRETLDLRVQGHPKRFQLIRLNAPITVAGPILHPKPSVDKAAVIAQGGAALALGAVLSPLAVLLPFVDAGLAKDANCQALMAEGRQAGAPVAKTRVHAR